MVARAEDWEWSSTRAHAGLARYGVWVAGVLEQLERKYGAKRVWAVRGDGARVSGPKRVKIR